MGVNPGLFSSATEDWATPQYLFEQLDWEFEFTLDPCATAENAKCRREVEQADPGHSTTGTSRSRGGGRRTVGCDHRLPSGAFCKQCGVVKA